MAASVINIIVEIERVTIAIIPSVVINIGGVGTNIRAKEERFDVDVKKLDSFFEAINAVIEYHRVDPPAVGGAIKSPEPAK